MTTNQDATVTTIQPWPKSPTVFSISADDGSKLLDIMSGGTVRGTIENAGPAAKIFITELRGMTEAIAAQAKAEALREAAEGLWPESLTDAVPRTEADRTARVIAVKLRRSAATIEGKNG